MVGEDGGEKALDEVSIVSRIENGTGTGTGRCLLGGRAGGDVDSLFAFQFDMQCIYPRTTSSEQGVTPACRSSKQGMNSRHSYRIVFVHFDTSSGSSSSSA